MAILDDQACPVRDGEGVEGSGGGIGFILSCMGPLGCMSSGMYSGVGEHGV